MKKHKKSILLVLVLLIFACFFIVPKYVISPQSNVKKESKLTEKEIQNGKGLVRYEEISKEKNLTLEKYIDIINFDKKNADKLLSEKLNADEVFAISSLFNKNKLVHDVLGVTMFNDTEALKEVSLGNMSNALDSRLKKQPIYHGDLTKISTNDLFVRSVLMGETYFTTRKEEIREAKRKIENCVMLKSSQDIDQVWIELSLKESDITTMQVGDFLKKCGYKDAKSSQPFYNVELKKSDNDDIKVLEGEAGEILLSIVYNQETSGNGNWKRFPYGPDEMNAVMSYLDGDFEITNVSRKDFLNNRSLLKLGDIVKYYNKENVASPVIRESYPDFKSYYYKDTLPLEKMGYISHTQGEEIRNCYFKIKNSGYLKYSLSLGENEKIGSILETCKENLDTVNYKRFI